MNTKTASARKPTSEGRHLSVVKDRDKRIMSHTHDEDVMSHPQSLTERLASRRVEVGLSQEEVADKIRVIRYGGTKKERIQKIARNTYCNYERGTVPIKKEVLEQVAQILQISVEWLMWGENKVSTIKELFPDWTEEDIVFALESTNGDLEGTVERITEGTSH